jgi:hypothetical protein
LASSWAAWLLSLLILSILKPVIMGFHGSDLLMGFHGSDLLATAAIALPVTWQAATIVPAVAICCFPFRLSCFLQFIIRSHRYLFKKFTTVVILHSPFSWSQRRCQARQMIISTSHPLNKHANQLHIFVETKSTIQ